MRTKRVLRAAVAFLFAFGVLAADLTPLRLPPQTASAVTQADIDKLKKESNALSSKKSEVNKQLSALKKDKANTLKRKALLDQQIDLISEEIANTEQQNVINMLYGMTNDEVSLIPKIKELYAAD